MFGAEKMVTVAREMQGGFKVCDWYCFAYSASHHIASHSRYTSAVYELLEHHALCYTFFTMTQKNEIDKMHAARLILSIACQKSSGDVNCECACVRGFLAGFCHNAWRFWFCMRVTVFHPSNMSLWFFFCIPNSLSFSLYPSLALPLSVSVSVFLSVELQ